MPTPEAEALEAALKAREEGREDWSIFQAVYEQQLAERKERLQRDAVASWRAMDGWSKVNTQKEWEQTVLQADADFASGTFLLERLGAERFLDPPLMAVLLGLRRRLTEEHQANTAAELLLIDSTVLAYYHGLRVTGWIGGLSRWLESEFFAAGSLTAVRGGNDRRQVERVRGLQVEEIVERLVDRLMPLLDRSNRMMLRNLKALRELRQAPAPSVSINTAGQVNVAGQQVNTSTQTEHDGGALTER